jgi:hypothetical protein
MDPVGKVVEHVVPQLIPAGALVTTPCPFPFFVMDRVGGPSGLKIAVTDLSRFTMTEQVAAAPEHAPDQPANTEPASGVVVRSTVVPEG